MKTVVKLYRGMAGQPHGCPRPFSTPPGKTPNPLRHQTRSTTSVLSVRSSLERGEPENVLLGSGHPSPEKFECESIRQAETEDKPGNAAVNEINQLAM